MEGFIFILLLNVKIFIILSVYKCKNSKNMIVSVKITCIFISKNEAVAVHDLKRFNISSLITI